MYVCEDKRDTVKHKRERAQTGGESKTERTGEKYVWEEGARQKKRSEKGGGLKRGKLIETSGREHDIINRYLSSKTSSSVGDSSFLI